MEAIDILVWITAAAGYVFDLIKSFFQWLFTPWLVAILLISSSFSFLKLHIDQRLDRIERRVEDVQNRISRRT